MTKKTAQPQPRRAIGLRRRWIVSSILPVITILVLIAALVSIALGSNYYANARSALEAKATAGTEYFNTYAMTSYDEYFRSATLYANSFEDSASIELQFLDRNVCTQSSYFFAFSDFSLQGLIGEGPLFILENKAKQKEVF